MIVILITLFFLVILIEISIFVQKKSAKGYLIDLSRLDIKLEIIRSLSYLLAKRKDLKVFANEVSDTLINKKVCTSFKLVIINNEALEVIFESFGRESSILDNQIVDYLKNIQSNEITAYLGITFVPLYFRSNKIGYILLTGNNSLDDDEKNLLKVLAGTLTLIIRGINFGKKLSYTDQLKAVSQEW